MLVLGKEKKEEEKEKEDTKVLFRLLVIP